VAIQGAAATALLALAACASAQSAPPAGPDPATPGYVAPSDSTVVARVDTAAGAQAIFVTNRSSVSIVVTGVLVASCENANPCGAIPLQLEVAPGQGRYVASVTPADRRMPFSFRYTWSWRAARR